MWLLVMLLGLLPIEIFLVLTRLGGRRCSWMMKWLPIVGVVVGIVAHINKIIVPNNFYGISTG